MTAKKRPQGRPKFEDPAKVRSGVLPVVYVNKEEDELLRWAASADGLRMGKWLRDMALRRARHLKKKAGNDQSRV
jgi:hypothetical protein